MRDIRFDLWSIRSLSTRSPLDCSRKCETNGTCLSFQYSSLTGQCRLFNTIFLHQDSGVYNIGWHYYIASNRRCRDSFIDARVLDMCFKFVGFHNLTEGFKKCAKIQSSIISITSAEQNDFLIRLVGTLFNVSLLLKYKRPFIQGFWDGNDWILDNGTPLVYANWDTGYPVTKWGRYIKLVNGKWRTTIASMTRSAFCSYNP
ncbi:uncharacterized protein LOC128181696 [Crassostrea angulata]|uniref:uncharacterized protein LOC128181696 n=1 Tax=Magallana angulata TaxID=2784310 RepID=UPI0022B1F1B0|nr:uncharacterized protein LOC128181696 [Crassostrea angulata]